MKKFQKKTKKKGHKYAQLSQSERDRIEILLECGHKQKEIAGVLKRSPSTISREVKRNSRQKRVIGKGFIPTKYKSTKAQFKARNRERSAKYQWNKINQNDELFQFIIKQLQNYQSPDGISGRMKDLNLPFYASKSCIYEWFETPQGESYQKYLYSGRKCSYERKKNKKKGIKREMIPNRVSIHDRPDIKGIYGHWEADTIVSKKSKTALAVAIERESMRVVVKKISNLKPNTFANAMKRIKKEYDVKSITLDNGIENRYYEKIGVDTFFCDPYSSWQKGKVEEVNKMIRWFVPKGSDISLYSDRYIKMIENILNNKYRKSLGYLNPYEVMLKNVLKQVDLDKKIQLC